MIIRPFLRLVLLVIAVLPFAAGAEPIQFKAPADVQRIYDTLIDAVLDNNITKFHSVCDQAMTEAITEKKLAALNESVVKEVTKESVGLYIGFYVKNGIEVFLFKVKQKTNLDDLLVIVSVNDKKCAGLLFQ